MKNEYNPIISNDSVMHLKEPSLGTYKAIKMLSLRYVMTPLIEKKQIMKEFIIPENTLFEELGVEEYYSELLKALFLEGIRYKDVDPKDINIMEVNRAFSDFFDMLNGD